MDEPKPKVQKYVKVPVTLHNHRFLGMVNSRIRRLFDSRLRAYASELVETLRRGREI